MQPVHIRPPLDVEADFTGFPRKGMLFCSIMMARTENGRQRNATPAALSTASRRMTER
jgi:hypothetical protein